MPSTAVVGIGNTLMGDDGVGAVIVRRLAERRLAEGTVVTERPNADAGLMKYFLRYDRIFVVDALDAGADPGSVFRFDPDVTGVTALRSNNIHGMGVGFLLTNARLCGASPVVTIFGVQVEDVRPRPDVLSVSVEQAIDSVVD
ncbi:hydrogenase maturation protease, partial [bacterium]|nr:hydrogenase maturation protease [bacterium]